MPQAVRRFDRSNVALGFTAGSFDARALIVAFSSEDSTVRRGARESLGAKMDCPLRTVLLVDDDRSIVQLVRTILEFEREAYVVRVAHDGQEALDLAIESLPDIILMDVGMPVMDGWTCYQLLKRRQETAEIPVILMSANAEVAKFHSAVRPEKFLRKPFEVEDLLSSLRQCLNLQHLRAS